MACKIKIAKPIWSGTDHVRKVGVAEFRMNSGILEIHIEYSDGTSKLWPKPLYMFKEKAMTYPVQIVKGVRLRLIPIADLWEDIRECRDERDKFFENVEIG